LHVSCDPRDNVPRNQGMGRSQAISVRLVPLATFGCSPHDAVDSVSPKGTLGSELRGAPGFSGAREPERVTLLAAPVSCCRSMVVILWVLAIETLRPASIGQGLCRRRLFCSMGLGLGPGLPGSDPSPGSSFFVHTGSDPRAGQPAPRFYNPKPLSPACRFLPQYSPERNL
jgi:hypothetical protein